MLARPKSVSNILPFEANEGINHESGPYKNRAYVNTPVHNIYIESYNYFYSFIFLKQSLSFSLCCFDLLITLSTSSFNRDGSPSILTVLLVKITTPTVLLLSHKSKIFFISLSAFFSYTDILCFSIKTFNCCNRSIISNLVKPSIIILITFGYSYCISYYVIPVFFPQFIS